MAVCGDIIGWLLDLRLGGVFQFDAGWAGVVTAALAYAPAFSAEFSGHKLRVSTAAAGPLSADLAALGADDGVEVASHTLDLLVDHLEWFVVAHRATFVAFDFPRNSASMA